MESLPPTPRRARGHRAATVMACLLVAACAGATRGERKPPRVPLEHPFVLALDDTVALDGTGVTLRFAAVVEDSRCPRDVQCIQAGQARLRLVLERGGERSSLVLSTRRNAGRGAAAGVALELLRLQPVPESGHALAPERYRATLSASAEPH